ncbi:MAG: hypothetical protein Q7S62_02730 [bacterium]|nr:hypothetical protein [bacterium]
MLRPKHFYREEKMSAVTLHEGAQRTGPTETVGVFCGYSERGARRAVKTAEGKLYTVSSWRRTSTGGRESLEVDYLPESKPVAKFCYLPGYGGRRKSFFLFPIPGNFEGIRPTRRMMRQGGATYLDFPSYLLAVQWGRKSSAYLLVVQQSCREDEWIRGLKTSEWTATAFNQILQGKEDEVAALRSLEEYLDILRKAQDTDFPGISTFVRLTLERLPSMPSGMNVRDLGWGATTVLQQGLPRPPNPFYSKEVV